VFRLWGFAFDFRRFAFGALTLISSGLTLTVLIWGVRDGIPPAGMDNCSICGEQREPGDPCQLGT
jgi:hypothetical protein